MKKVQFYLVLVSILIFSSCSKEDELQQSLLSPTMRTVTSSSNGNESSIPWDECTDCYLPNGITVKLPWASTAVGNIPTDVRKDVKQVDGWRLLYSNVEIIGCNHEVNKHKDANYLLLYNRYSGVLKGFFYAPTVEGNNYANWLLTIPKTKLFNFASYFATPGNTSDTQQVTVSNISTNGIVGGFDKGWNCFMLELSYDPNSINEELDISGYAMNKVTYTFTGAYNSMSEGTLITTSSSSVINTKGIASSIGNAAKSWIASHTSTSPNDKKPLKLGSLASSIIQDIANTSVSTLAGWGLNKIFASLLGYNVTNQNYSLQFSTNGSVKVDGESVNSCSGYITPLMGIPLNGLGENLGVWNLAETPKYSIDNAGILQSMTYNPMHELVFQYSISTMPSIKVIKNPAVTSTVATSFSLVEYTKYDGGPLPCSYIHKDNSHVNISQDYQTLLYDDGNTVIKTMPYSYIVSTVGNYPNCTYQKKTPAYNFSTSNMEIRKNVALKVVTKIYRNNTDYVYSSKTYIPSYEFKSNATRPYSWTFNELNSAGYLH